MINNNITAYVELGIASNFSPKRSATLNIHIWFFSFGHLLKYHLVNDYYFYRYQKTRENNRKHPAEKSIVEDFLNLNFDFEMMEDKEIRKDNDNVTVKTTINEYDSNIYFNHASTNYNTIDDTEFCIANTIYF